MVNITHKNSSLRKAIAQAMIKVGSQDTINAIISRSVPKGDVFEMAKTAGLFAVKKTSDVIPDCHPLPIEFTSVKFEVEALTIQILVEVHTLYKTGVEVEAMHGASVVALTMYDMLKPIDKNIEIQHIKLLEKQGGKSDFNDKHLGLLTAAVIVCSDSIHAGKKVDLAGKSIIAKLEQCNVQISDYIIIPDEATLIQEKVKFYVEKKCNMIIFTGGTGLSKRDTTPEALIPMIEKHIPGVEEAIRSYGQQRTPYSMLSRSVAGLIGKSLILALPGSTKGAKESMDAIFPSILHLFNIIDGQRHEK